MMRNRLAILLVLVSVLVLAPSGIAGGEADPRLILTGARSASLDWALSTPLRLQVTSGSPDPADARARIGKDFVGFTVHRANGAFVTGAVAVRGFVNFGKFQTLQWLGPAASDLHLGPGRYRVTLLTDGPSSLSFRIRSGTASDMTLRPSRPVTGVSGQRADLTPGLLTAVGSARVTTPVNGRQWLLAATFTADATASRQQSHICVGSVGARCAPVLDDTADGSATGCCADHAGGLTYWARPGFYRRANYDVVFTVASTGLPESRLGFVLVTT